MSVHVWRLRLGVRVCVRVLVQLSCARVGVLLPTRMRHVPCAPKQATEWIVAVLAGWLVLRRVYVYVYIPVCVVQYHHS